MSEQKQKPSLNERLTAAEKMVRVADQERQLDLATRIAEAGQKAMGLEIGEGAKGKDMILGDVTINETNTTGSENISQGGIPKWASAALAGAGLATGGLAFPAGAFLLSLFNTAHEAPQPVEPPPVVEESKPYERGGLEIFRPSDFSFNTALVQSADGITVYTATWCGPCNQYKPTLRQLAKEGKKVRIVDIDQHPNKAVKALPTTFFWADGVKGPVGKHEGVISLEQLRRILN